MQELKEIIDQINEAKRLYYTTGRSPLTDYEYDELVKQAESLGYVETVGTAPVNNIEKITHDHLMLSLDKCHTVDEISKFIKDKTVISMWKADGLSISCTYIDGILTKLETRGDGEIGNNIMFHAGSFENLPKVIHKSGKYVIDGECVILQKDFLDINSKLADDARFSNSRNLAAGSLNLLDPKISAKRHLRFYAWDVIEGGKDDSIVENLREAQDLGFDMVMCGYVNNTNESIQKALDLLKRSSISEGFPIDGVVFKYDQISYGKTLGKTGHHFKNGIAYKFFDERIPSKLQSVTFQVGKTGQLTPIANFTPVTISDTVIEKCSLHNISVMKQLGLTNGCTVYIYKANDIIPQIDSAEYDGYGDIKVPSKCPICGGETKIIKENDSEVLYCMNPDCHGKVLQRWATFVSKKAMDIAGLSEATLDKLLKLGYINSCFVTIYQLGKYKKELYKLDGFGKKSIDNLLAAIENSKDVDLIHFITAFSIPGIGEGQAKLLTKKYRTFEEFAAACDNQERFDKISGIGPILHLNIINWWFNNNHQMIDVATEVRFKEEDFMNPPEGNFPLAGKTFCITGSVSHYKNRGELQKDIEKFGGKVASSVSKNTNYLINNDKESASSKNVKAKSLGVQIISEEDFLCLIK